MGKLSSVVFYVFYAMLVAVTGTFVAVVYDMEVLSTGGRNTIVLSELVDGTEQVVELSSTGDQPSMMYPASVESFEVDRITVTLWGRETFLGKNLNAWLRQLIDPSARTGNLYRVRDGGALLVH